MVALPAMIEPDGIPGEQAPHDRGQWRLVRPQQQVEMGRKQSPGETLRLGLVEKTRKTSDEPLPIVVVEKHDRTFDPANDDMLKKAGNVEPRAAWHAQRLPRAPGVVN